MTGILAVWNDRADDIADQYERWYATEHIPERLAVPGFRSARRYEAVSGDRAFFTFYELDSADVLRTPAYTDRLASPTTLTREIMTRFHGMVRSVFEEVSRDDAVPGVVGGAALVIRLSGSVPRAIPHLPGLDLDPIGAMTRRLWTASSGAETPPVTTESRIRPGRDEAARGALIYEVARVETAQRLAAAMESESRPELAGAALGCFRLLSIHGRPT